MTIALAKYKTHSQWKRNPIITGDDAPKGKRLARTKTIKQNSGRVEAVCLKLSDGTIIEGHVSQPHFQLTDNYMDVVAVGWKLENGNYVWR